MDTRVALTACSSYDQNEVDTALNKALTLIGGIEDFRGKSVLINPNLLSASAPEKAVTTHPALLRAVIRALKQAGCGPVYCGDSPGLDAVKNSARISGLEQACREEGARWVPFTDTVRVQNFGGKRVKQFDLTQWVEKADIIISLPKLKTHQMMYYTGAMKNLFGLIPGLEKSRFHFRLPDKDDFADMICDLNLASKPVLAIMDGITAMEGHGPGNGTPRQVNRILASANLLALDICGASLMGYDPLQLPIQKQALDRGFWLKDISEIEVRGESLESSVIDDFQRIKVVGDTGFIRSRMPGWLYKIISNLWVPRPFFRHGKCIRCQKCLKICPAGALELKNNKIRIDYNKCIRCYCCDEVCPVNAIKVRKGL